MKAVWKFELQINDEDQVLQIPSASSVCHVEAQNDRLCIWIQVDTSLENVERRFRVFGTGQVIPEGYYHVGTALMGPFVWHVYEP